MGKYSAEELSRAGDQLLGRSYEEMDCQEFVERCLQSIGLSIDLRGSNAWFRKMTWTGSPEECRQIFGSVPTGAFLFIWANDGGEVKRGYHDGKGNASHIGIVTHRNDGAIHSSQTRGGVATSVFRDKTIKNGGWNMVGLWDRMDYGKTVNWLLEHMGIGGTPAEKQTEEDKRMTAIVHAENGGPVNMRAKPSLDERLYWEIQDGTKAEIIGSKKDKAGNDWSHVTIGSQTGWIMSKFLATDDSDIPSEDFGPGDLADQDGGGKVALYFTAEELGQLLPVLESAVDQIMAKVGRG